MLSCMKREQISPTTERKERRGRRRRRHFIVLCIWHRRMLEEPAMPAIMETMSSAFLLPLRREWSHYYLPLLLPFYGSLPHLTRKMKAGTSYTVALRLRWRGVGAVAVGYEPMMTKSVKGELCLSALPSGSFLVRFWFALLVCA